MTEDQLEQETLAWLADVGYQHRHGPELAPEGSTPERSDYRQVLLIGRLRQAINLLNRLTYASINTLVGTSQFGLPNSVNPPRKIQTSLILRF